MDGFIYGQAVPVSMARTNRTHGTVSLPTPLLQEVDRVVDVRLLGFRSRAELIAEATRTFLRDLQRANGERR